MGVRAAGSAPRRVIPGGGFGGRRRISQRLGQLIRRGWGAGAGDRATGAAPTGCAPWPGSTPARGRPPRRRRSCRRSSVSSRCAAFSSLPKCLPVILLPRDPVPVWRSAAVVACLVLIWYLVPWRWVIWDWDFFFCGSWPWDLLLSVGCLSVAIRFAGATIGVFTVIETGGGGSLGVGAVFHARGAFFPI